MERALDLLADNSSVPGRLVTSALVVAVAAVISAALGRLLARRLLRPLRPVLRPQGRPLCRRVTDRLAAAGIRGGLDDPGGDHPLIVDRLGRASSPAA